MLNRDGNENGKNKSIGLTSQKTTLHLQHTFFVNFFAVVLHEYNVKLFHFLCWRKLGCWFKSRKGYFPFSFLFFFHWIFNLSLVSVYSHYWPFSGSRDFCDNVFLVKWRLHMRGNRGFFLVVQSHAEMFSSRPAIPTWSHVALLGSAKIFLSCITFQIHFLNHHFAPK